MVVTIDEPVTGRPAGEARRSHPAVRKNRWLDDRNRHLDTSRMVGGDEVGQQVAEQEVGGLDPDVRVVAHLDALRGQAERVDRAVGAQRLGQHGPRGIGQEAQPIDGGIGLPTEPWRLAGPLVEGGERGRRPSRTATHTGCDGPSAVTMGTTRSCALASRRICPSPSIRSASSRVVAHPSATTAARMERRSGSQASA